VYNVQWRNVFIFIHNRYIVYSLPQYDLSYIYNFIHHKVKKTRKPCYHKDDRAMCPIYGCPEKFRESSQTTPATFPEICKGLLFRSILRMCVQNLKFVPLSVPEIIGGTPKIWGVPGFAHAPYSPKFLRAFVRMDALNIPAKFEVRSFTQS